LFERGRLTAPVDLGQSARMSKLEENDGVPGQQDPDQQPIQRIVGRRVAPPIGHFPSAATRSAMDANLHYLTRAPKGIFVYRSHDEMTRDRELWTLAAMLARHSDGG
jgi:hypothetical protein